MLNVYELMKPIAEAGFKHQKPHEGDYFSDDGMLMCGVCKEPRWAYIEFDDPTEEEPDRRTPLKVVRACRCDREEEKAEQRKKKDQEADERISRLRRLSLMDEKFNDATFENFSVTKANERNFRFCRNYAKQYEVMMVKNQGLLFYGDVGTGKSFAAACIANDLMSRGISVVMTSFVKILEALDDRSERETDIINRVNSAKLLIIDDLGTERSTSYGLEKVYNIIDTRYRKKLPMILTTNIDVAEMKSETDIRYSRIYDRIFEVCYPLPFAGTNWRKKQAGQRFQDMADLFED